MTWLRQAGPLFVTPTLNCTSRHWLPLRSNPTALSHSVAPFSPSPPSLFSPLVRRQAISSAYFRSVVPVPSLRCPLSRHQAFPPKWILALPMPLSVLRSSCLPLFPAEARVRYHCMCCLVRCEDSLEFFVCPDTLPTLTFCSRRSDCALLWLGVTLCAYVAGIPLLKQWR